MSKSAMVRARIEPKLKQDAEQVLRELGLGVSEAICMFYPQIVRQRALRFAVALDSAPTDSGLLSPPATKDFFTDLASLYKRLEELDEWRTFSYELAAMKFPKALKARK